MARLALPQVSKEGEEDILNDFFRVVAIQAKRCQVSEQRRPELFEEADNFLFQARLAGGGGGCLRGEIA